MSDLKKCPCCGLPAKVNKALSNNGKLYYMVGCSVCSVHARRETKWEAQEDWNRRVKSEMEIQNSST